MALRARLSAPTTPERTEWPYHEVLWTAISSAMLVCEDRRMEAENYLSNGYSIRRAMEKKAAGQVPLSRLAEVWQPSRLKGIQVSPDFGTAFLAATQVFDVRPIPRKWLSLDRTETARERFVGRGTILVTCSGSVGRATLAFSVHEKTLITHDLLRVKPRDEDQWGWLYAYLRAPKARAMMTGTKYGHIIKHLEPSHLEALPIPTLREDLLKKFREQCTQILGLRDEAHSAALEAETRFADALGDLPMLNSGEHGFCVKASQTVFLRGRRMDACRHNPRSAAIRRHLRQNGKSVERLKNCGYDVWVPGRYKRIPAPDGIVFIDSSDLFEMNPDTEKRFADCRFGDDFRGRVKPGWLLMASSGQTYGLVGGAVLATTFFDGKVVANHVIRIAARPGATVRPGYVLTALTHPDMGRPLIKALAFGSSVPEVSPEDVSDFEVIRLPKQTEDSIADLAERAARLRAEADILETKVALAAEAIIDHVIADDTRDIRRQ